MDRSGTKVAIVGAGKTNAFEQRRWANIEKGPAGMVALKEFRDLGFDVTVFEKKDNVGGAWCWSEDAGFTTALRETKLCNNKYSVGANISYKIQQD